MTILSNLKLPEKEPRRLRMLQHLQTLRRFKRQKIRHYDVSAERRVKQISRRSFEKQIKKNFENKHFEDSVLYSQAKNNNISNFVSYSDGWGTFNLTTWINKNDYPFNPFYKFNKSLLSLNERRIDELWQSATNIFSVLFRG